MIVDSEESVGRLCQLSTHPLPLLTTLLKLINQIWYELSTTRKTY